MSGRSKYQRISDIQREVLVRYYDKGMTSKAISHQTMIEAAAKEAKLSEERVKVREYAC